MSRRAREVRAAIRAEVARAPGVTLGWAQSGRWGEAILRRNGNARRVVYVREGATKSDVTAAVGRTRRALAEIAGMQ